MRFKISDGSFTSNESEIIAILTDHFTKVFNNDVSVDWTVLDDLKDKQINVSLNETLTFLEFKNVIKY